MLFDTGRAELNPGASVQLDQLAQFLKEHPDRRVEIDGFTDSVGSDTYNETLSQRRADAVKSALVVRGIDPSRLNTEGYGKSYPVASNNDSGGRQLNRRVEVIIGGSGNAPIAPRAEAKYLTFAVSCKNGAFAARPTDRRRDRSPGRAERRIFQGELRWKLLLIPTGRSWAHRGRRLKDDASQAAGKLKGWRPTKSRI